MVVAATRPLVVVITASCLFAGIALFLFLAVRTPPVTQLEGCPMTLSDCEDFHYALRSVLLDSEFSASYQGALSRHVNAQGMWAGDYVPYWSVYDRLTHEVVSEIRIRSTSKEPWGGIARVFTYGTMQFGSDEGIEHLARDDKGTYTLEDVARILSRSEGLREQ